jgi:hypothetical protein
MLGSEEFNAEMVVQGHWGVGRSLLVLAIGSSAHFPERASGASMEVERPLSSGEDRGRDAPGMLPSMSIIEVKLV